MCADEGPKRCRRCRTLVVRIEQLVLGGVRISAELQQLLDVVEEAVLGGVHQRVVVAPALGLDDVVELAVLRGIYYRVVLAEEREREKCHEPMTVP